MRVAGVLVIASLLLSVACIKEADPPGAQLNSDAREVLDYITSDMPSRVLYVDSYHAEYIWSEDILRGVHSVLEDRPDVELKVHRMDTKRNQSEEFKLAAAAEVVALINSWQPKVVIAADDNASKYVIAPHYIGADLPFVFCGLNWDASVYGFPADNITGMIEVPLIEQTVDAMDQFAAGPRIGFLASDTVSERKELEHSSKGFDFEVRMVSTFDDLKQAFLELQSVTDMLLIRECRSVEGFDHDEMVEFVNSNTSVPTGSMQKYMIEYVMITYAKIGEEQGEYAAQTALEILAGKSPADIPVVPNKKARIFLNMEIAGNLGVEFPMDLVENATFVSEYTADEDA